MYLFISFPITNGKVATSPNYKSHIQIVPGILRVQQLDVASPAPKILGMPAGHCCCLLYHIARRVQQQYNSHECEARAQE